MGSVYLSHTRGGQPVALKVIRREFAQNAEFRMRFGREVEAARRVHGAYTAAVVDSKIDSLQPWLASAYVPGPSLGRAVFEHGPLSLHAVLLLTAGVAEALQSIHAVDVVHRDLKPSNVLLAADGPRVIDFGIARSADAAALTGTDVRLGTPAFMSPEQAEGKPVTPMLDVFALGLLTYYAATGQHPFGEGDPHTLLYRIVAHEPDLSACPELLRPLVARCLTKEPTSRPTLSDVIDACHQIAATAGTTLTRDENWWQPASSTDRPAVPPARTNSPPAPLAGQSPSTSPSARWQAAQDPRQPYSRTSLDGQPSPTPSPQSNDLGVKPAFKDEDSQALYGDLTAETEHRRSATVFNQAWQVPSLFSGRFRRTKIVAATVVAFMTILTGALIALGVLKP